jgi:hypothetical protein
MAETDKRTELLGTELARYEAKRFNVATNIVSSIGCSIIGLILTIWAVALALQDETMCVIPASGAFFAFVVLFFALYELRRERGFAVSIHEHGLRRQLGGRTNDVLWHEITSLTQSTTVDSLRADTVYELQVQKRDGSEIPIRFRRRGITPDGAALAETLQNTLNEQLTPRLLAQFGAGETVSFGPFQLNQEHLAYQDKRIAWLELEKAAIREGEITIWLHEEKGLWARSNVARVPNIDAFVAILEQKLWLEAVDLVTVYRHRPRGRSGRR